ncbi:MAG: class I SAM-dependent methyltransferase [Mycolicibacterium aromaticivorans]|nr:class I SAM-dependent methyltransferase [Mycolicibacterium aromaticivorans]
MSKQVSQDLGEELAYQARQAGLSSAVRPTPAETFRRYREHRRWRTCNKEFLFHCVARAAPKRICDFGCGAGETSTELAAIGFRVVGFDLSPDLIALARERARLDRVEDKCEFVIANANALEMQAGRFDLVLVQNVLHHLELAEGLATLHALLAPGGVALIQEPIALSPLLQWLRDHSPVPKDISPNEHQINAGDLRLIEERFEVVEHRHFHLLRRLGRFVPERHAWMHGVVHRALERVDFVLLALIPPLRRFAGQIVLVCQRRA